MDFLFQIYESVYLNDQKMTHTHRNFGRLVTSAAIFLGLFAGTLVIQVTAQTPASLSKKELKHCRPRPPAMNGSPRTTGI